MILSVACYWDCKREPDDYDAYGLPVAELRRVWSMQDSELVGPIWAITFGKKECADASRLAVPPAERGDG